MWSKIDVLIISDTFIQFVDKKTGRLIGYNTQVGGVWTFHRWGVPDHMKRVKRLRDWLSNYWGEVLP